MTTIIRRYNFLAILLVGVHQANILLYYLIRILLQIFVSVIARLLLYGVNLFDCI